MRRGVLSASNIVDVLLFADFNRCPGKLSLDTDDVMVAQWYLRHR